MIKVNKPAAPQNLTTSGVKQTQEDCAAYENSPEDYRFNDRETYKKVKDVLEKVQYDKCCYCESKYRATSYGAVEHYRPKGGVAEDKEHPGYYWLAYTWDNLLVSCAVCNTSHKKTLFPLVDESARARSHNDDIDNEQPLFINPAIEDPRKHIRFIREDAIHRGDIRGQATIKGLGLMRPDLVEDRRTRLGVLEAEHIIIELGTRDPENDEMQTRVKKAQEFLNNAIRPEAEFSSMARDFIEGE